MDILQSRSYDSKNKWVGIGALFLSLLFAQIALGHEQPWRKFDKPAQELPPELANIGITEKLGDKIDLGLTFNDESGKPVQLGNYFDGHRPTILALVYYSCPGLCNFVLNGATETFNKMDKMKWTLGDKFDMVVVSIDPSEKSDVAQKKKDSYLAELGIPTAAKGWHFLTGSEENIKKLAAQVGFGYQWDKVSKQWAHAAAMYVLSPDARIMRYLYGITYDPKTVKLSLLEASDGKAGSVLEKLILQCYQYNPDTRGYAFYAYNIVRAGGGVAVILFAAIFIPLWFRERRQSRGAVS